MEQILIVEDDRGLNQGLCRALQTPERRIFACRSLAEARAQLACSSVALILLDVNLPDGSGISFLRESKREAPNRPVILLTANDTDIDIVEGLEEGADDYITKPFSLAVLRARVNTQLKKAMSLSAAEAVQIGPFYFDFAGMRFFAAGHEVFLSKTEQKLLYLLVKNKGLTMGRSQLVDRIWTDGAAYVDENALSVAVKRLRDKLGAQDYIKTVYGVGYSWVQDGKDI